MTTSETTALPGPAPTWLEHMGDRVVVYTLRGSYAERRATDVLHGSELVARELERLLAIETFGPRIKIYLVDAPAGQPAHGRGKAGVEESEAPIVFAVEPETAGGPPPSSLARVLVARWFSGQAAGAELVLAALGGLAAARAGVGPSLEEANAWVRQELENGRPVSILGDGTPQGRRWPDPAAVSFGGYLVSAFGVAALSEFLRLYDPSRRDAATVAVFQRPFGSLEEAWLASLRQRRGLAVAAKAVSSASRRSSVPTAGARSRSSSTWCTGWHIRSQYRSRRGT